MSKLPEWLNDKLSLRIEQAIAFILSGNVFHLQEKVTDFIQHERQEAALAAYEELDKRWTAGGTIEWGTVMHELKKQLEGK